MLALITCNENGVFEFVLWFKFDMTTRRTFRHARTAVRGSIHFKPQSTLHNPVA